MLDETSLPKPHKVVVVVVVVVVVLLGNLNRPLIRPPYRVPEIFHDSTVKKS